MEREIKKWLILPKVTARCSILWQWVACCRSTIFLKWTLPSSISSQESRIAANGPQETEKRIELKSEPLAEVISSLLNRTIYPWDLASYSDRSASPDCFCSNRRNIILLKNRDGVIPANNTLDQRATKFRLISDDESLFLRSLIRSGWKKRRVLKE